MKNTSAKTVQQVAVKELKKIPGVGISIANDLLNIGITSITQLKGKDPYMLYDESNAFAGVVQDRCLLYVFKCAVYYAETPISQHDPEKLKWWYWQDAVKNKKAKR